MAVFSVPVKPAHGRGDAGRPRYLGDARDDPAMGPQIRPGIRQPDPSASASPWRQMAPCPLVQFTVYKKSRPERAIPDPAENLILFSNLAIQGACSNLPR